MSCSMFAPLDAGFSGFDCLTHRDQRLADGGSLRTCFVCIGILIVTAGAAGAQTRRIAVAGTTSIKGTPSSFEPSTIEVDSPEFPDDSVSISTASAAVGPEVTPENTSQRLATSNPEVGLSFDGLRFRDSRTANGGNQFSWDPPDQGLCVGNGYVLEAINSALRVYSTNGNALVGTTDLNTFYGYPAGFNRSTGAVGPIVVDESCFYDASVQRWLVLAVVIETVGVSAQFSGVNHLDLAVSQTANPLGAWNLYRIAAQDDGTDGTPNHHCPAGPCLADYPHLGADANGIYLTTNEIGLFFGGFHGAQIYAIAKTSLAVGSPSIAVTQIDTADYPLDGLPGFTVWPATIPPGGGYASALGGTEYFLSSITPFDISTPDNRLRIWALSNTSTLNTATPTLALTSGYIAVQAHVAPPTASQSKGAVPFSDCLDDDNLDTPLGKGCWYMAARPTKPKKDGESQTIDTGDSRMQQIMYADGKLWAALGTGLKFDNKTQAGIAYFIITPSISGAGVSGSVVKEGYIGLANEYLSYPAFAVNASGHGIIAFSMMGPDYFPSAGYATVDVNGAGPIHIVAVGLGPDDTASAYRAYTGSRHGAARWGDYGAAAVDGSDIWIASEYIGQTCTYAEFTNFAAFGSCGGTRATLGNYYTRISKLTP